MFYNVVIVSTGIADLPAGVPCRRDEGIPPYRNDGTPAKGSLYSNSIPLGGRGRSPLPHKASPWGEAVARRLMRGCFLRYACHSPTPHSSLGSLRSHSCHLPACSIATSPLWLKTVPCGLFLRCFAPPRRAPSGEGKILFVCSELRADEGVRPYCALTNVIIATI